LASVPRVDADGVCAGVSETLQQHLSLSNVVSRVSQHPGPQQQLSDVAAEAPHAPAGASVDSGSDSRPIHATKRICVRKNFIAAV
jgi:hypothetical protein